MSNRRSKKRRQLRNNEYYNFQEIQDNLYKQSIEGKEFKGLMPIILSQQNILLAYRNIKKNKGSKTPGTNKNTIINLGDNGINHIVEYVRRRLENFTPHKVRRKEIEKEGGGIRPLGIPTIEDRLIQQCIKQVLEPICEAKFYNHSYGFRSNRSTEHALARAMFLINRAKLHYAVDVDIKGFFDNVDHGKLLKQMWTMGIRDKKLLGIISRLIKAEIESVGKPEKGTPQGGIISPILSNIVLNELDWWIYSQWEGIKTVFPYKQGNHKIRALQKTNLKEMYIVRYADDFKIFCRGAKTAQKAFVAVKQWLKERLKLDISPQKSKVINLKKNYSNFLGFKLKAAPKRKKCVAKVHISDKSKKKIIREFKEGIKLIVKNPSAENVNKHNAKIIGWHNYYKIATQVNADFSEIAFLVRRNLYNGTRSIRSSTGIKTKAYERFYGNYNFKMVYIAGVAMFPIAGIRTKNARCFSQSICNYTESGRRKVHERLKGINPYILKYLLEKPDIGETTEYNDNRISLYVGQNGKCAVTNLPLKIGKMHIHHKKPKSFGGKANYSNLIYVREEVHILIHAISSDIIKQYKNKLNLDNIGLEKLNMLRKLVGNYMI